MKRRLFSFIIFGLCETLAFNGWAGPSNISAPASVSNGQSITITGTSFGTKSPAKPQVWAPFDGNINPSNLGIINSWAQNGNMSWNSTCGPDGGGCALGAACDGNWDTAVWTLFVDTSSQGWNYNNYSQKTYLYRKSKHNWAFNGNTKVFRPQGSSSSGNDVIQTIVANAWGPEFCGDGYRNAMYFPSAPTNWYNSTSWNTEEILTQANTDASSYNAYQQWDINGSNVYQCDARAGGTCYNGHAPYIAGTGCGTMNLYSLLHVTVHDNYPNGGRVWADDLYMDNTWARVMICSGNNWSNRGTCEMQIPSAWSATSATVTVHQGSLTGGNYLYVVDATNAANSSGVPITFGGSTPVNGTCGSSNGQSLSTAPTTNLCSAGAASSVAGSGPWTWTCSGSNGGTTASCSASLATTPVNGACGSSNGQSFTSAPTTNLCSQGTASSVSGSGPWSWTCSGSNGGTIASCLASLTSSSSTVARSECTSPPTGTIFCEDFEGTTPKANFDDYDGNPDTENLIVSDTGPSNNTSNKAIRFRVPAGERGGSDLVKVLSNSYDKLYARWYFKYEPGFNFSAPNHGGGLTAGDRNYIGMSGQRPSGSDFGWFGFQYDYGNTTTGIPFLYSYYRGMYQDCADPNGSCWGDSLPCIYGSSVCKAADTPSVSMPTLGAGQWYCYEQMIDMGTPSVNGTGATGRITQWLNGSQIGDNTNLWLRTTSSLKLQNLWLSLFHHDGTHSTVGELFDNVVVSTQRIGCGSSTSAVPDAPPVSITNIGQ